MKNHFVLNFIRFNFFWDCLGYSSYRLEGLGNKRLTISLFALILGFFYHSMHMPFYYLIIVNLLFADIVFKSKQFLLPLVVITNIV